MGKANRQRRKAKQQRTTQRTPPRARDRSTIEDDAVADLIVICAVQAWSERDAEGIALQIANLVSGPPRPGGVALADRAIARLEAVARSTVERNGWSNDDLHRTARRTLSTPALAVLDRVTPASAPREQTVRAHVELFAFLLSLPDVSQIAPPPPAVPPQGSEAAKVLARVRALLAKAESTTFQEEADALTAKAQELMTRHAIDVAMVDAGRPTGGPVSRDVAIDDPYAQAKAMLLGNVASANHCEAVWASKLGFSTVIGFEPDIAAVELLFTSLLVQATSAVLAAGPQVDRYGRSRTRSFRQAFLVGFGSRIGERLREATRAAEADAAMEHGDALLPVLARRHDEVEDAVAKAFPRMTTMRTSVSNRAGLYAGVAAADKAALGNAEVTG